MTDAAAPHLDLDALADVLAGESPSEDTSHLRACPSCTSRLAELEAAEARVVAVLSTLPPPPVPEGLAERLSAALADDQPPTAAQVTTLPTPRAPRRTWLPAAAAAVAVLSAGGIGYALLAAPGGNDAADTAASTQPEDDLVLNASGTDYADAAAVEGVLPNLLRGRAGAVELDDPGAQAESGGTAGGGAAQEDPAAAAETGDAAATTAEAPTAALAADALGRLRTRQGLRDCLSALLPPDEPDLRPLALDYASYAGQPALAVVLPDPDPAKLSVFVVGPQCSQADDSTLHFFRIDAP